MPRTKRTDTARTTLVPLITLPAGATFEIPSTGRKGLVLRTPSTSSAYCRLWFRPEELERAAEQTETTSTTKKQKPKAYEDITVSSSTLVLPTSVTESPAVPAVPAAPAIPATRRSVQ